MKNHSAFCMAGCTLALALASAAAGANPIFKCTGSDGEISYQSTPCGTGAQGREMPGIEAARPVAPSTGPSRQVGNDSSVTITGNGRSRRAPMVLVIPPAPAVAPPPPGVDPMEVPITDNLRKQGFFTPSIIDGTPATMRINLVVKNIELPATLAARIGIQCDTSRSTAGNQGTSAPCGSRVHSLQIADFNFADVDVTIMPTIHTARMGQAVFDRLKAAAVPDGKVAVELHPDSPQPPFQPAPGAAPRPMGGAMQGRQLPLRNLVTTFAGTPAVTGSRDGTGRGALFNWPFGIATDGTNLFVADFTNRCIRKIVIATGAVTTLAGRPRAIGSADGAGSIATFNFIQGITTDGTTLYVTDVGNHNIRKVAIATGFVSTLAGLAGNPGSADGIGTAARFNYPWAITTDGANLYVTDDNNATIRKIALGTGAVTTLAGKAGFIGHADGIGTSATFYHPYGITTDGTNLYVSDSYNNTIRKIVIATGAVSTLAGVWDKFGDMDGAGSTAMFYRPAGITTDGTNLYVTDNWNHSIRKIVVATGAVTTLAGVPMTRGYADGQGLAASFNSPYGITTDGNSLYVTDTVNATIRKIQ